MAPTRKHDLNHTDHTDHTDHESICPEGPRSLKLESMICLTRAAVAAWKNCEQLTARARAQRGSIRYPGRGLRVRGRRPHLVQHSVGTRFK